MEIELNKEQYHKLLEITYITDWVLNAYRLGQGTEQFMEEFSTLQQVLFAKADRFGYQDYVKLDIENNQYFLTAEFDKLMESKDGAFSYIDQFEEHLFWEALCERLARRDIESEIGCEEFSSKNPFERYSLLEQLTSKYHHEFKKNGLQNLKIADQD